MYTEYWIKETSRPWSSAEG